MEDEYNDGLAPGCTATPAAAEPSPRASAAAHPPLSAPLCAAASSRLHSHALHARALRACSTSERACCACSYPGAHPGRPQPQRDWLAARCSAAAALPPRCRSAHSDVRSQPCSTDSDVHCDHSHRTDTNKSRTQTRRQQSRWRRPRPLSPQLLCQLPRWMQRQRRISQRRRCVSESLT